MSLFVLDTDILTLFEREHATVATRIAAHAPATIAISVVLQSDFRPDRRRLVKIGVK